ncbi:MAG: GtrA family protein [Cyanobacteria bacterium P01_F01_bin.150]
MARSTRTQLFRFLLTGGSTVLIDLLVYKTLLFWLPPSFAKAISFLCGTAYAYQVNRTWTFSAGSANIRQALRFIAVYGTNLVVNVGVNAYMLSLLPTSLSFRINIAFLVSTSISALLNFLGMKLLVFKAPNARNISQKYRP